MSSPAVAKSVAKSVASVAAKATRDAATADRNAGHGRTIFLYNNLQTNQVVYSLTRAMKVPHRAAARRRRPAR